MAAVRRWLWVLTLLVVWLVVLIDMALPSGMSAKGKAQSKPLTNVSSGLDSARPPRVCDVSLSGRSPGLRGAWRMPARVPSHIAYRHSGSDSSLAYRCGGSAGLAQTSMSARTGFPFHPVKGTRNKACRRPRSRAAVNQTRRHQQDSRGPLCDSAASGRRLSPHTMRTPASFLPVRTLTFTQPLRSLAHLRFADPVVIRIGAKKGMWLKPQLPPQL